MHNLLRWSVFTPIAAGLTFGLFLLMRVLISAEFSPQEKIEVGEFEISPKVEKIQVADPTIELTEYEKVETPPPPPILERVKAEQPKEKFTKIVGTTDVFDPFVIKIDHSPISIIEREAQPIFRTPPIFPPRFLQGNNSGYCKVRFDVSAEGLPFNIRAIKCTSSQLKSASIKSVHKWKYNPKIVQGRAVARTGVESKIRFDLQDERGRTLPLPNGI